MSNIANSIDVLFSPNVPVPTYYTNVAQVHAVGDDEICLSFCIRSQEKPQVQANLQCRVITTIANLKRLNQGFAQFLHQYELQMRASREQAEGATKSLPHKAQS